MANIAQTINVLQSMILTKGKKMLLTPSYHVFEMYKVHQDATMLPIHLETEDYKHVSEKIPALNVSASKNENGKIHVSICNTNPNKTVEITGNLRGSECAKIRGRILTSKQMNEHNTFDNPNQIVPCDFSKINMEGNHFRAKIPAMSVVVLELR